MSCLFVLTRVEVCAVFFSEEHYSCRVASFVIAYHHEKYVKSLQTVENKFVMNLLWGSHAPCSV